MGKVRLELRVYGKVTSRNVPRRHAWLVLARRLSREIAHKSKRNRFARLAGTGVVIKITPSISRLLAEYVQFVRLYTRFSTQSHPLYPRDILSIIYGLDDGPISRHSKS